MIEGVELGDRAADAPSAVSRRGEVDAMSFDELGVDGVGGIDEQKNPLLPAL